MDEDSDLVGLRNGSGGIGSNFGVLDFSVACTEEENTVSAREIVDCKVDDLHTGTADHQTITIRAGAIDADATLTIDDQGFGDPRERAIGADFLDVRGENNFVRTG